jgi:hypothetical protein
MGLLLEKAFALGDEGFSPLLCARKGDHFDALIREEESRFHGFLGDIDTKPVDVLRVHDRNNLLWNKVVPA